MIQVQFNIWTWKDYKKWFWDKFCFPRRKEITNWLTYHNSEIIDEALDCYSKSLGFKDTAEQLKVQRYQVEKFEKYLRARINMQTEKTVNIIITCK